MRVVQMKKDECCEGEMPPGLAPRVAVSAVVCISWLIFLVIFLFFYAQDFGVYKTLAILITSVLVVGAILAPMWIYWGMKTAYGWKRKARKKR